MTQTSPSSEGTDQQAQPLSSTNNIDSADGAIHTNTDLLVTGGTFEISTGDNDFHADDALVI